MDFTPVGSSANHNDLLARLRKIAATDAEVLLCGASGTGKELYARYIHENSGRSDKAMVPVNCGALAEDLLENVLFGHVAGAFTGARERTEGLVQSAEGSTLFLDEVDTLAIPCQIKLLRFLQDREYRRIGETTMHKADVRIVAACNRDLVTAIQEGDFREDLFFRLRVCPVDIPNLTNRLDDLDELIERLSADAAEEYDLDQITFSRAALQRLRAYPWPGNIRELQNCVVYLTCLQKRAPIQPSDLPLLHDVPHSKDNLDNVGAQSADLGLPLKEVKREVVNDLEKSYIETALSNSEGNVSEAARNSGKARRDFFRLMRKHDVDPGEFRKKTNGGGLTH